MTVVESSGSFFVDTAPTDDNFVHVDGGMVVGTCSTSSDASDLVVVPDVVCVESGSQQGSLV